MLKFFEKAGDYFYFVFRILIGLLFFQHGIQKLFGLIGGAQANFLDLMWFAGLIEFLVGLGVIFGFFTRLSALGGALEMLVAYFIIHFPQGWIPVLNDGELALLYFASFLVILVYGSRRFGFERLIFGKELF